VQPDSATQASITFQCFFRYYPRLAGMTVGLAHSSFIQRLRRLLLLSKPTLLCRHASPACCQGTARTEAQELSNIYRLEVVTVPPHRPKRRIDHPPRLYLDRYDKTITVLEEVCTPCARS
jgi:preprotein translocase subunit SecA